MEPLRFVPFGSAVQPGFWSELTRVKLEVAGLGEEAVEVLGTYTSLAQPSPRIALDWDAFQSSVRPGWAGVPVRGRVTVKNTVESFKSEDKAAFISRAAERVWSGIQSGAWLNNPGILSEFAILMFADLKKFRYYYWFAFPSFSLPAGLELASRETAGEKLSPALLDSVAGCLTQEVGVTLLVVTGDEARSVPLASLPSQSDLGTCLLCVADPAQDPAHPGWPARNLLLAAAAARPGVSVRLLCVRTSGRGGAGLTSSLLLTVSLPAAPAPAMPAVVGWERTEKGQLGPRLADMRSSLDPTRVAEQSVDLNLKLMKWRLVPDLDLAKLQAARCLLLGSGTLGCGVARGLLGWGVRNISLVDSGRVSYSNPVRQNLFQFQDCLEGGRPKAIAAAERLREVFPGVVAKGYELAVPMPGHPASPATRPAMEAAFSQLQELLDQHDIIFLLMDSRESRWLPTALTATQQGKLVINAALGFDSYLVMRHGVRSGSGSADCSARGASCLGCYFCNDVVAPGDSTKDRTLDQQCTVTRPGASGVAAALAVELAVSTWLHPLGPAAPAPLPGEAGAGDSVLGAVPHTIRGSLSSFTQMTPTGPVFPQCTACSPAVTARLGEEGFRFMVEVGERPSLLEDITGLTTLLGDTDLLDGVIDLADDDTFSVSSSEGGS